MPATTELVQLSNPSTLPVPPSDAPTEASYLGRIVAVLTPLIAAGAALVINWVARTTGAELDTASVTALMVSAVTAVLASSWKWLQGWQQHELLVATGRARPVAAGEPVSSTAATD